jgi:predicted acylesterase/phospholipase RssA
MDKFKSQEEVLDHFLNNILTEYTPEQTSDSFTPRTLICSAIGSKAFSILGFLLPLQEEGFLNTIDTFCGISTCAIISLLLLIGHEVRDIIKFAVTLDIFGNLTDFADSLNFGALTQKNLNKKGIIDISIVKEKLNKIVSRKLGYSPSLKDLYNRTGKSLIIFTLNIKTNSCEVITPTSHPNLNCIDAVSYAINVPIIYQQEDSSILIDASLSNPYPVDYFDDGKTNIISICTKNEKIRSELFHDRIDVKNISSYFYQIMNALLEEKQNSVMHRCSDRCMNVIIPVKMTDPFGYTSTTEDKAEFVINGYNLGLKYIESEINTYLEKKSWKYEYPSYILEEES